MIHIPGFLHRGVGTQIYSYKECTIHEKLSTFWHSCSSMSNYGKKMLTQKRKSPLLDN